MTFQIVDPEDVKDLKLDTYKIEIPEVYQIEVTAACNFECPFCIRGQPDHQAEHIDPDLFALICERDMKGSYYSELQFTGEPLLHPKFGELAKTFGSIPNLNTGLSTNGSYLIKHTHALLRNFDFLTVSVDSVIPEVYMRKRVGGTFDQLMTELTGFLNEFRMCREGGESVRMKIVDLQVIDFFDEESELPGLQAMIEEQGWGDLVRARSVPDCFAGFNNPALAPPREGLCLNPWMSVSIHSDGDVVPCCFAFGKEWVYGNLKDHSLEEIWQTSERRKELQQKHVEAAASGNQVDSEMCSKCYMRSPTMLHFKMLQDVRMLV